VPLAELGGSGVLARPTQSGWQRAGPTDEPSGRLEPSPDQLLSAVGALAIDVPHWVTTRRKEGHHESGE